MNGFWLLVLVIYWSHYVLTQTLEAAQHSALMSVYDALGASHVDDEVKSFRIHLLFFVFRAGCIEAVCPRFDASSNCTGSGLRCSGGSVTQLCVLERCDVFCLDSR
jgi:hypothetical protein